ncbi:MAG: DUF4091 domain-containing protein, partial [Thermoguttaceae bacterium]|nr:DUF4091 domain-containing protein [Thermoguttaceae bacterium]
GAGEPLRFVSANVSVDSHYFVSGRCVVEISADGQNWQTVGTLEEKGVVTGTAEELFASPVETLFVRCRAEENASFQIHGLTLAAELDSDRFTGRGETIYAEVGGDADSADQNFEVTPLYFDKEELCCRVVNKADEARAWPLPAFSVVVDGGDEVPCPASVRRVGSEGADDGKMAAGESALYLVDLSNHPSGKEAIEKTCRFDKSYSFTQRVFPCFVQDYTYPLDGIGGLFGLSWCEADWRVPRAPWYVKMKKPQPIAIAAPRNDFESFQVVVRPTVDLANLTAESSDLAGPDGAVIPRENIQVRWGYYHFVDVPTDYTCARGWYVDAMVPITVGRSGETGAPLSVAAGDNQPIFVTVYVPAGTPKGDYTGKLTIGVLTTGVGAQPRHVQVPFKLTVWDFDQPKKNRFETAYGFSPWEAFRYQNASTDQQRRSIWEKYLKNASDHRISFYDSTPLDGFGVTFDTENLKANFDFAAFDAEMARVTEKYNVTNFKIPVQGIGGGTFDGHTSGGLAGFSVDTPEFDKLMRDYLGQLQEHLRDKGWLDKGYVYWFDEPEPKDYGFVAGGFGHLKKYAPDLPRMLTEEPSDAFCDTLEEAGGNVDIWCPISNCYSSAEAQKRMAKGERFWWYVCTGPKAPYCTEFTDHPAHELRLWHWQAFERGITGSLIWATNYWTSSAAFPDGAQDPYVDPMCYVVGYGTPPGTKAYWGNGDGRFFYPPLAAATPGRRDGKVIDEEPVNSIRWEELREGIEDYEMLLTLRERFEANKSALSEEDRAEIEKLFDFSEITTDMTHFTGDPTVILLHRARVAEAIERLGE